MTSALVRVRVSIETAHDTHKPRAANVANQSADTATDVSR